MAISEREVLRCTRCGEVARRLVTPPRPLRRVHPTPEVALVCERCLTKLEQEYSLERQGVLPPPGPGAIEEPDDDNS